MQLVEIPTTRVRARRHIQKGMDGETEGASNKIMI